jgi:hypothetical protein
MLPPAACLFTGTNDPVLAFEATEHTLTQFCAEAEKHVLNWIQIDPSVGAKMALGVTSLDVADSD